jgi:hypothetical protein
MKFLRKIQDFFSRSVSYYADGLRGTALPHNSPIYVERKIDNQVYQFLRSESDSKIACYVFGSPQTGKSSLALRLSKILEYESNVCILVSIESSRNSLSTKDFYLLLANQICNRFRQETDQFYSGLPIDVTNQQRVELSANDIEDLISNVVKYLDDRRLLLFVDGIHNLNNECLQDFTRLVGKANNQSIKYLNFALFGELHPENFLAISKDILQTTKTFQVDPLSGECKSLQAGINSIISNKNSLIENILFYTHGQPFLTIYLLHLSTKYIDENKDDYKLLLDNIIQEEIINDFDANYFLKLHFERINDVFVRGDPQLLKQRFYALETYKSLLDSSRFYAYNRASLMHKILIESGLVVEIRSFISIANLIYKRVFDLTLIGTLQQNINLGENAMAKPNYSITDREFFFLTDSSASMLKPMSGDKTRFKSIQESVEGHVTSVINHRSEDGKKICDEVTLTFFNVNRPPISDNVTKILDPQDVSDKFDVISPAGSTFITPTFKQVVSRWVESDDRGDINGAVVIYVDGLIDDRAEFVAELKKVARKLDHHSHLKILFVGIGEAINSEKTLEWYFDLDLNGFNFRDANNDPCNLVIFNRIDDVDQMGGVIPAIKAQLIPNPESGLPVWLSEQFPNLYEKLEKKYDL